MIAATEDRATYTLKETAARLGTSTETVRREVARTGGVAGVRVVRVGRRVLVPAQPLERVLQGAESSTAA